MATDRNIVDIYPLAPMQRLYFAVSGLDREVTAVQLRYLISGDLDRHALEQAWRYIVARHSILRTGFVAQDLDEPLQVVFADPPLSFGYEDLAGLPEETRNARIQEECEKDKARGFNFEAPPLMRVRLFRTGDFSHLMIWSYERILLDGWSLNMLLQELSAACEAFANNRTPALSPAASWRDFIAWMETHDFNADMDYWQRTLAGYRDPVVLAPAPPSQVPGTRTYRRHIGRLSASVTAGLLRIAKASGVTVNTMVQSAWAMILSGYAGRDDVVFGYSVAGRPVDLPGVETIAGLFTNNLPMRVRLNPEEGVLALLRRIQMQQVEMTAWQQTPFSDIRRAADLPVHQRLFDTLVVYQSHAGAASWRFAGSLQMTDQNEPLPNNYPATLIAVPGRALKLVLSVDSAAIEPAFAESVLQDVKTLLECMSTSVAESTASLVNSVRRTAAMPAPAEVTARPIVAARDTLELQMVGIFQQAFGRAEIGATDNFFALGGHSLLAVWLFQQIEQTFNRKLPLATLLHACTPEALAAVLRRENWTPSWSSLVPINPGGSHLPLFCIHGGGGNVLFYRELAARLGPNQPFYALQPQGMDGKLPTHTTVAEMAEHYITEIRQLQPRGPYRIGGASFGGMVAFEMARRLRQQGHEVGLVALFDTHGPGYPQFRAGITRGHKLFFRHWERLDYHARNLFLLDNRGRIDYLGQKLAKAKHMLRLTIKRSRKRVIRRWHELLGNSLPADLIRTQNAILHALQSYKPLFYDGEITVFRATRQPMGVVANETLGWAPYARDVRVIDVPGYHTGIILEPHVHFMADKLRASLDRESDASDAAPADSARLASVAIA